MEQGKDMSDQIRMFSGVAFSGDSNLYFSQDGFTALVTSQVSDIELINREGFKKSSKEKGYSIIEGCIRQTMDLPIENSGQH